ncbi:PREDICTED: uncharacterized protein LOC104270539 [Apaloderma vittatum]|uniref:uncharacterized protein LOC104270539 n=1 Tax=Apaloderma vittatum TaxID=57397 RepID=UPI00052152D5|nr:PREDICTED: uncharacterized protein LOC104270539 [Apaloderma vittatum]
MSRAYNHPFEDDVLISMETLTYDTADGPKEWEKVPDNMRKKWKDEVLKESPEKSSTDTSDTDEESDASIVSIRRKFEDTHFQNPFVGDGKIQETVKVQVDVIVQEDTRKIPKWITILPQGSSESRHLALPMQEAVGTSNKVAVCSKRVESSAQCSSSRPLQLQLSGVPISPDKLTIPRHRPFPEPNETCCDSLLENHQSAHEESSWGDATLADLYPAMVEVLKRFMTKQSRRKASMFGYLRHKRCCSRRPTLSVTVDKIRGFRPPKLKRALPSICSSRSEDIQNQTFGNENRKLCAARCSSNNLSGLVPSSYIDTNEIKVGYSDLSSEHHFASGKGQKVSEQTVFPTDMTGMRERFLAEDELQTTTSPKNLKGKESEKLAYKRSFEHRFITPAASSGLKVPLLVNENKTQKTGFSCGGTSELSSPCSSYGNRNTFKPITNCSLARPSNTLLINPEKTIFERLVSFQCRHSSSSLSVKQSPSYMPQIYDDAFEKLYQLCSKEIQKPFVLTRPLSKFQNLEGERRLVKSSSSDSISMRNCVVRLFQNFLCFKELQI